MAGLEGNPLTPSPPRPGTPAPRKGPGTSLREILLYVFGLIAAVALAAGAIILLLRALS